MSKNESRDKGSRLGVDRTPDLNKIKNDPYVTTNISENGSQTVVSHDPKNPFYAFIQGGTGAYMALFKDGQGSLTLPGEARVELDSATLTVRENIDLSAGGHLTVKTVGGLEAQISGDGDITIAGATNINILDNAAIAVKGNAVVSAKGKMSLDAAGGLNIRSGGDMTLGSTGKLSIQAGGGLDIQPKGPFKPGRTTSELASA